MDLRSSDSESDDEYDGMPSLVDPSPPLRPSSTGNSILREATRMKDGVQMNAPQSLEDPRRPEAFTHYKQPFLYSRDDAPINWSSMVATVLGMAGVMIKNKYFSWLGCFFMIYYLTSVRSSQVDWKQLVTACSMCLVGVVTGIINDYRLISIVAYGPSSGFSPSNPSGGVPEVSMDEIAELMK